MVEVSEDVHRELRKLAVLNGLKVYEVTDALLREGLADEERVRSLIKKLQQSKSCR